MKFLLNVRPKGKDLNLVYSLYMYFNNDFVLVGAKSFFASMPTFVTEVEFSLCAEQQILLKLNRYIFFFAIVLFLSFSTLYLAKKNHLQPNKIWQKKPSYHKNDVLGFRVRYCIHREFTIVSRFFACYKLDTAINQRQISK